MIQSGRVVPLRDSNPCLVRWLMGRIVGCDSPLARSQGRDAVSRQRNQAFMPSSPWRSPLGAMNSSASRGRILTMPISVVDSGSGEGRLGCLGHLVMTVPSKDVRWVITGAEAAEGGANRHDLDGTHLRRRRRGVAALRRY